MRHILYCLCPHLVVDEKFLLHLHHVSADYSSGVNIREMIANELTVIEIR